MCIVFIFQSQEQGCFCLAFLSFFSFSILLKNKIKTQKTCQNEDVTTFNRAHRVQRVLFAQNRALFCRFATFSEKVYIFSFLSMFQYQRVAVCSSEKRDALCVYTLYAYTSESKKGNNTRYVRKEV